MNRYIYVIILSLVLTVCFFQGCKKHSISEEERAEYYELNKQNSLRTFTPVMYNASEGERRELFKIVHISDAHLSTWSHGNHIQNPFNLIEAIRFANDSSARINAIAATGDHISNSITTTRNEAIGYMNIFTKTLYNNNHIPTFTSTGNHDANMMNPHSMEYAFSKQDLYTYLTSKINYPIQSEGNENYYYADLVNPMGGKIRIIALDVTDQDILIYSAQHNAILSQKQIDWLCHTALKKDMTENHSVIILTHHPFPPADDEALSGIVKSEYLYNWHLIPDIVESFRTKQELTRKYRNKLDVSDSISVSVSFVASPGEFICYLGGHLHTYLNYEVKSPTSSLPNQLMIIANNMSPSDKSSISPIERSDTGLRNNTFNLYAIDTKKKMIYVAFFGATGFYYPNIIALNYL